jgi:bifunctional non-homologous end joining protein LigD
MERFAGGIDRGGIFQEQVPASFPDWIKRVTIREDDEMESRAVCDDAAGLVYFASESYIAVHSWLSRIDFLDHPDRMVFDLNPPGKDFEPVGMAAMLVKDFLEQLQLTPFLMTTGGEGLHIIVPLDRSENFESVHDFARSVVRLLAEQNPSQICPESRHPRGCDEVWIDISHNAYGKAVIAPYSVRPSPGAPVAKPIYWSELGDREFHPKMYTMKNVSQWLSSKSDPWTGMMRHGRSLKEPKMNLESILLHSR